MPKNKAKGSKAERELYDMFVKENYRAVRTAGSGTMENADCDLIAGKKGFPTFAVLLLIIAVLWILTEINVITINIPWFPVILGVIALGWIIDYYGRK